MKIIASVWVLVVALMVSPAQASFLGNLNPGDFTVEIHSASMEDATLTILEVKKTAVDFVPGDYGDIRIIQGINLFGGVLSAAHSDFVFNVTP